VLVDKVMSKNNSANQNGNIFDLKAKCESLTAENARLLALLE